MILSEFDIQERRKAYDQELRSTKEVLTVTDVNYVGHGIQYFFKHPFNDGSYGICGVKARILKMTHSETGNEEIFKADLAIESHQPGFYVELLGVEATSVIVEEANGNKTSGICPYADVDAIEDIVNKKFVKGSQRPKLQLIVNNPGTQDTPVEPT